MYIRQAYQHSKWLAVIIVFFAAAQLFVNYKRGVVISPFYHYGMYSDRMLADSFYSVFEVDVDDSRLHGKNFTATEWDRILLPLQYFAGVRASNQLYKTDVARLLNKLHISAPEKAYVSGCNYQQFAAWYKQYLALLLQQHVERVNIAVREYQFTNGKLQATNKIVALSSLCN